MKFDTIAATLEARKPRESVRVPVAAWAETWEERPREQVVVGLRAMSEGEKTAAVGDARKHADAMFPEAVTAERIVLWVDAYNDFLMRRLVARGACDPNDIHAAPHEFGGAPEELVAYRLSAFGVKFFFDAIERFEIAHDTTREEASDETVRALAESLPLIGQIPTKKQARIRRLIQFCMTELQQT